MRSFLTQYLQIETMRHGSLEERTGITIEGAFNGCSACVEIMADDDNGVSMMHYIDYEDIIGVELIKN